MIYINTISGEKMKTEKEDVKELYEKAIERFLFQIKVIEEEYGINPEIPIKNDREELLKELFSSHLEYYKSRLC